VSSDPSWQEIISIFKDIEKTAQKIGDLSKEEITKFTNDYLQAQKIQYSKSHTIRVSTLMLPLDIYRNIFFRLSARQILNNVMRVSRYRNVVGVVVVVVVVVCCFPNAMAFDRDYLFCREWYRVGRDNEVWRYCYNNLDDSHLSSLHEAFNYYGLYRTRFIDLTRSVMVLGNKMTYMGDDTPLQRYVVGVCLFLLLCFSFIVFSSIPFFVSDGCYFI
jgi:hypothetical protein